MLRCNVDGTPATHLFLADQNPQELILINNGMGLGEPLVDSWLSLVSAAGVAQVTSKLAHTNEADFEWSSTGVLRVLPVTFVMPWAVRAIHIKLQHRTRVVRVAPWDTSHLSMSLRIVRVLLAELYDRRTRLPRLVPSQQRQYAYKIAIYIYNQFHRECRKALYGAGPSYTEPNRTEPSEEMKWHIIVIIIIIIINLVVVVVVNAADRSRSRNPRVSQ